MLLLISAIVPVIIFLYIIYRKDTIKEPTGLLLKCFIGGIFSAIPALLMAYLLSIFNIFQSPLLVSFYNAFFEAAIAEEIAKFLILYWLIWKSKDFDQHYDGIIYAVFVSLGFAAFENILYVYEHGFTTAVLRAVTAVPAHGFFGVAMGYFLSLAKFSSRAKGTYIFLSLFIPILLHGVYDFVLMYWHSIYVTELESVLFTIAFAIVIIVMWRSGFARVKAHVSKDKADNEQMNTQLEEK